MMGFVGRSYLETACAGRGDHDDGRDVRLEGQEKTGSVVGRKRSAEPESAVRRSRRLSRIGCPDHFVESHCSLEHYRYSSDHTATELYSCAVHQQIRVALRPGMMRVELGRSSHHCYSNLKAVIVGYSGIVNPRIHADPAPGMKLGELGLNSHRCLSFARRKSTRSCCFGSAKSISM